MVAPVLNRQYIAQNNVPARAENNSGNSTLSRETRETLIKLKQDGKLDEAAKLLKTLLNQSPNSPELLFELSSIYYFFGKTDEAKIYCDKAAKIQPNDPKIQLLKGRILRAQGKMTEARSALEKAVRSLEASKVLSAESLETQKKTYFYLALISLKENDLDKAKQLLEKALKLAPNYQTAKYFLASVYAQTTKGNIDSNLHQSSKIFASIDNKSLLKEFSELSYENYKWLRNCETLTKEIIAEGKKISNDVKYDPTKDVALVKKTILAHPQKEIPELAAAFLSYNVTYVPFDPASLNTYTSPEKMLLRGKGDCDDFTLFYSSILRGANIKFENIAYKSSDYYNHTITIFSLDDKTFFYADNNGISKRSWKSANALLAGLAPPPLSNVAFRLGVNERSEVVNEEAFIIENGQESMSERAQTYLEYIVQRYILN
jgi:Tfp pilus assembly protein PilF